MRAVLFSLVALSLPAVAGQPKTSGDPVSLQWFAPTCSDTSILVDAERRVRGACGRAPVSRWTYQTRVSDKEQGCTVWAHAWCTPPAESYEPPGEVRGPTLYNDKDFKGTSLALTMGAWELREVPQRSSTWNDKAGSARVPAGFTLRLCEDPGGAGRCSDIVSDVADLSKIEVGNDKASFAIVANGPLPPLQVCPVAYEHDNFKGKELVICADIVNLTPLEFNDKMNSISVPAGWAVELCAGAGGSPPCKVTDVDIAKLGSTVVKSDRVSSVKITQRP